MLDGKLLNMTTPTDDHAIDEPMDIHANSCNCENAEGIVLDLSLSKGIIKYLHIYSNFVNFTSTYNEQLTV